MSPPIHAPKGKDYRVPSELPTFTKADLKKAIPVHCFERSLVKSFGYLFADLLAISVLFYLSTYINELPFYFGFVLWPAYWILQGGVGTGVWVVAHECGHYAFADSTLVCDTVGLILHSALTVPYHSWRISHAKHHRSTGDIDRDEVFLPHKASELKKGKVESVEAGSAVVDAIQLVGMFLIGWYMYLFFHVQGRDYGKHTDHYNPNSPLFKPKEAWLIIISDIGVALTLLTAVYFAYTTGFWNVVRVYVIPVMVVNFWLLMYTFLHHTDQALPHYTSDKWNWLQGALATVDRDYGIFWNTLHHDIGNTHVLHHLFSKIPHYHAKEASEAIKPILGDYYLERKGSVFKALWEVTRECRYVDDSEGNDILWWVPVRK